jgi:ATP-dependent Clp protease ATP-binding subunit ClpC
MKSKGVELEVQQVAKDFLIEHGTDEKFGARPLRRAIEQHLEDNLSEAMLRGEFAGKNKVVVSVKEPEADDEKPSLLLEGVVVEKQETDEPEVVGASHTEEAT